MRVTLLLILSLILGLSNGYIVPCAPGQARKPRHLLKTGASVGRPWNSVLFGTPRPLIDRVLDPVEESPSIGGDLLKISSSIPLAFLGVRTSYFFFLLFGVGLVSKLITKKNATKEDAPNWNHVITSKEQEQVSRRKIEGHVARLQLLTMVRCAAHQELHAFTCENCGFTIFPARGREGKFFPDNYKCMQCGAPKEAFFDRREEVRVG